MLFFIITSVNFNYIFHHDFSVEIALSCTHVINWHQCIGGKMNNKNNKKKINIICFMIFTTFDFLQQQH